ncbi:hypothetical protein [Spiroplasma ixodetis]|uniref:Adhesin P123 n=1 Tax=Spiroplasma ixodetis TaxID=2141 RepID=A0ABM8BXT4_9MOLU|nr:hypothetical protein [Spiroplasma ixodetis]BDT04684.1 hypothetical protein SHM_23300 [Spiroplasma ixodetis]
MILDWPDEIGTLPPEALQNNPQIGDYTHAATCDFSAKQQKRITTNENSINLINNQVQDIKNNWFNIETSPLWKKVENINLNLEKWYIVIWSINYIKAFLPLCTILILSHKCWEKPIYGLLPTFLNQT